MSKSVLLVDDHRMMLEGLRSVLEAESGYEVVGEALDGRTAVEMARTLEPDVVVMDIGMPDLNGVEATRQIMANDPDVRIVALSTHTDKRYVLAMLEAGASAYVLKVSAYDELRRAIGSVTEGKHYLSPDVAGVVVEAGLGSVTSPKTTVFSTLGAREREVLQLLAEGHSSPEIAKRLHISPSTVETHRRNIMRKLDVHSVAELTKYAVREGLTPLGD
ncbi:MAG: response regulator transcription factor [Deltaproteobacteria bacterium]|nr:response regulator transcription factor [Deltaproteobacteria bacterium]MBW2420499.1 response regulator transcription factor [Deltaproteobacteria bacterium]